MADTIAQLDELLATPVADDPLLTRSPPPRTASTSTRWNAGCAQVVDDDVRPALEDLPRRAARRGAAAWRAPTTGAACCLPDGDAAYAARCRYYTTTDLTPQEIHDIGLAQIAKLADEYRRLGPEVVGTDDLPPIFAAMRDDPALHLTDGDEIVEASRSRWPSARGTRCRDWFEPAAAGATATCEPTTTGAKAFYFPPAEDGSRGGVFFINVSDPDGVGHLRASSRRPSTRASPATTSSSRSPASSRTSRSSASHLHQPAYAEGWGLYTERLADEMGLYGSAVDRMGMLAADSMRACRLVVDTGMHALGWSRQQAIDYLVANSPLQRRGHATPRSTATSSRPARRCSYMVGRLEILRMRADAEQRQGDRFDIKAFHDAVLDSGSLPLSVLSDHIARRLA